MDEKTAVELADKDSARGDDDVFLWANNLVPLKEDAQIDLFLFNKNGVVYRPNVSKDLQGQLPAMMLDGLLEYVLSGAAEGLVVREFEEAEDEGNVLQRTELSNVTRAVELLNWLTHQEAEIEQFVEEEHDIKRVRGVVARCSHSELSKPFYVIKYVPSSHIVKGTKSWMVKGGKFVPFTADGSIQIPADNQLLVLGDQMYVFNQTRLEQLFGYNAKKYGIAEKKMAEIEANFSFSFDTGLSWQEMFKDQKTLVNKLQKLEIEGVNQDDLMDRAEELGLDLMRDSDGSIIIMSPKDLAKFINLLNDDYMESPLTGKKYEVRSKKPLRIKQSDGQEVV